MGLNTFKFRINPDLELLDRLIAVERFDALWPDMERRSMNHLNALKLKTINRSLGAVLRLEGFEIGEDKIEHFFKTPIFTKDDPREMQIFGGYIAAYRQIVPSKSDHEVNEPFLKALQNVILEFSQKDDWHRGDYKRINNNLENILPDGSKELVFRSAEPGLHTIEAMQQLLEWYHADHASISIIKIALFFYEFLCIRPFQDGNGRMSYLLVYLLMLKSGYSWIRYVSLEHEIQQRKPEFDNILTLTQKERPSENVAAWLKFFLSCLMNLQQELEMNLNLKIVQKNLTVKEKRICTIIENQPGLSSSEISTIIGIPLPSVKKMLSRLVTQKFLLKEGTGKATHYSLQ
ncbi:MAG: Fic family protein [Saprospiraceae bacterium]|nr:Fic family protein [Candidatus Vicinibacter affinis]